MVHPVTQTVPIVVTQTTQATTVDPLTVPVTTQTTMTHTLSSAGAEASVVHLLTQEEELLQACPMEFGTDAFFDCKHLFYESHTLATFTPVTNASTVAVPEATVTANTVVTVEDDEQDEEDAADIAEEDEELFEGSGPSERDLEVAQSATSQAAFKSIDATTVTIMLAALMLAL